MTNLEAHVETLAAKAATEHDSGDAMRFAQAALNLANAMITIASAVNIRR